MDDFAELLQEIFYILIPDKLHKLAERKPILRAVYHGIALIGAFAVVFALVLLISLMFPKVASWLFD